MTKRARKNSIRAFTLIELMMVIAIMAILAAATGFALAEAMQQGRVSRTQAQVARIHSLLMQRYDSYRTRPLRIPPNYVTPNTSPAFPFDKTNAIHLAAAKLSWIRQIMRYEMPERPHDIGVLNNSTLSVDPPAADPHFPMPAMPSLANTYRRIVNQNFRTRSNPPSSGPNLPHFFSELRNYESECLYLILSSIQEGETNGLDFLLPSEIGDTDGDGMSEVLDSWGTPIVFLRWAPGVDSPLQTRQEADPFDPMSIENRPIVLRTHPVTGAFATYMLVPLVVSAGPDGRIGMHTRKVDASNAEVLHDYSTPAQNQFNRPNDPFCIPLPTSVDPLEEFFLFGQRFQGSQSTEASDNIINHFLSW